MYIHARSGPDQDQIRNSSQAHRPPAAPGATQTDELFCSVLFSSAAALWNGNIMAHSIYQLVRPHQGSWLQQALLLRLSEGSFHRLHGTQHSSWSFHSHVHPLSVTHACKHTETYKRTHTLCTPYSRLSYFLLTSVPCLFLSPSLPPLAFGTCGLFPV